MRRKKRTFQIECGSHHGVIDARSPEEAWRMVTGDATEGFGELARYRECHPATANRKHRAGWGPWFYISPRAIDLMADKLGKYA